SRASYPTTFWARSAIICPVRKRRPTSDCAPGADQRQAKTLRLPPGYNDITRMSTTHDDRTDLSLVLGGPLYQLYFRTQVPRPPLELLHRRIIVYLLITWLPLLILAAVGDELVGGVTVPFLLDLGVQSRLLASLPLLIAAELIVHDRIRSKIQQFFEHGLIAPE